MTDFQPEWFSPPGEAVAEKLERSGKPMRDFAWEMELNDDQLERLLDGRLRITDRVAQQLEKVLGGSAAFWTLREAQYRKDMYRLAEAVPSAEAKQWLKTIPLRDLTAFGWIEEASNTTEKVAECMRYFDISSLSTFDSRMNHLLGRTKFRSSQTFKSNPGSLSAWIRRGELEAVTIRCEKWNPEKFRSLLGEFRKLTMVRQSTRFLPPLRELCASAGVALVIARAPSGCRASGVTKFLDDSKALLMLSFRHLSDDHFWFSFFHECGHLLLHEQDAVFIEGEEHECSLQEGQANEFAATTLVPEPWSRLLDKLPLREKEIIRFSVRVGVAPGIIVGQLQHRKRLSHNFLNHLKRRYRWA